MALAHVEFDATDESGNLLSNVQARVELEGGGLVSIYSDRAGSTPYSNPQTFADGKISFYVAGGAYKITLTSGAFSRVLRYRASGLLQEKDALSAAAVAFTPAGGLSSTNVQEAIEEVASGAGFLVSVSDYGAVGDGTADDTAAIQDAIDATIANGGKLWLPKGRYRVTDTLLGQTLGGQVFIEGEGKRLSVINCDFALTKDGLVFGDAAAFQNDILICQNFGIEGTANLGKALTITRLGNAEVSHVRTYNAVDGIVADGSFGIKLSNNIVSAVTGTGIELTSYTANNARIEANGVYGAAIGIDLNQGDGASLQNNEVANCTTAGIRHTDIRGITFFGNYVENNLVNLAYSGTSFDLTYMGNWFGLSTNSNVVEHVEDVVFERNVLASAVFTVGATGVRVRFGHNFMQGGSTVPNNHQWWTSDISLNLMAQMFSSEASVSSPSIQSIRGRGSMASPAAVQSGDRLFAQTYGGQYDTTVGHTRNGAAIIANATELWSVSAAGCEFSFETTPNGSTTRATAMTIGQDKKVTGKGAIVSDSGTGGVGYAAGAGGAVSQATSRTTGVTLNKVTGAVTLVSAAGSTTFASFTVTNSTVAATDTIIVNQKSGADIYEIHVTAVAAGSFRISFRTTGGTTTEQPVFNFAVIKAVAA